jgi:hypothetical protein
MLGFELTPEQMQLKETARRFSLEEIIPVAGRYDEEQRFPEEIARKAWELGLMNFEVPSEYGGLGLGILDTCLVLEELNYGCAGITNVVAANGLATTPLVIAGTEPGSGDFVASQSYLQPPGDNIDLVHVIKGVIEAETGAIDHYNRIIEFADEHGDPVTADMVTTILADEEGHRRLFEGFLREYEREA